MKAKAIDDPSIKQLTQEKQRTDRGIVLDTGSCAVVFEMSSSSRTMRLRVRLCIRPCESVSIPLLVQPMAPFEVGDLFRFGEKCAQQL